MKMASSPPIQAAAPPSEFGAPVSAYDRAASAVSVTGDLRKRLKPVGHGGDGHEHRAREDEREDHDEPCGLRRLGAPNRQRHEGEDPTEGEAEGGDDGYRSERPRQPSVEAKADDVADHGHQPNDQDVA